MRKYAACLLVMLTALLHSLVSYAHQKTIGSTIRSCSFPISGTSPSTADSDLFFLPRVFEHKAIIGLGEATHGTKEFFEMKHRLVKYLVGHMEFKVFAIEANFSECVAINDYVMYGKGSAEAALKGIYFWTWNTVELLDMITWMRQYNSSRADKDKVQFWGIDMQYGRGAAEIVLAAVKKYNIHGGKYDALLDTLSKDRNNIAGIDDSERKQLKELYKELEMSAALRKQYSREAYELLLQHAKTLLQATEYRISTENYRDSCMTENVKWLYGYTTEKIIVWAHNSHIAKEKTGTPYEPMGKKLAAEYKDNYYALGFDFGTGSFRAYKDKYATGSAKDFVQPVALKKIPKGTASDYFHQTGLPQFFIDFKHGDKAVFARDFLADERKIKVIGAIYWPKWEKTYYHPVKLPEVYDGIIYIDKTTAATPINSFFNR
jgi:erythromycin esterase